MRVVQNFADLCTDDANLRSPLFFFYFSSGTYFVHPLNNVAILDFHYHYHTSSVNISCLNNVVVFFLPNLNVLKGLFFFLAAFLFGYIFMWAL